MDGGPRLDGQRAAIEAALRRGAAAVASDQLADGSWRGSNDAGSVFTALALALERALGVLSDEHAVLGVRFLRAAQLADGSVEAWQGARRGNHEATCFWYAGMQAAGVAAGDPAMVAARRAESYADPTRAGEATISMPGLIGLVVCGLVRAGLGDDPRVANAIHYLLATQDARGAWPDNDWLAPSLPPRMFYRYPAAARFYPMAALARWSSR